MTALARETTVTAYPLGQPVDGRKRYGMTPEQAILYRWLVQYRPHNKAFRVNFRHLGQLLLCKHPMVHARVQALIERGWLIPDVAGTYRFVHPVMHFKGPAHG